MASDHNPKAVAALLAATTAAAAVAYWTSFPALRDETAGVTAVGGVYSLRVMQGDASFAIRGSSARYLIARADDGVVASLRESEKSGNAVSLNLYLEGARFGMFSDTPEYWVRSVEYLNQSHGAYPTRIRWSWRDMGPGDEGLLRGFALEMARRHAEAVKNIDSSLDAGTLGVKRRALAHRVRGSALEGMAYPAGSAINARDDRLLVRALEDYRQSAALDPSDYRIVLWQANVLRILGAYEEALALYEEVERRWPEHYYRTAIIRGATHRQMGNLDAALSELDELVRKHGPQDGMMYHYHRGWTLEEMQRYPEAVQELTAGLASQPDFEWAYIKRACAYALRGDIERALADQKQALEISSRMERLAARSADTGHARAALEHSVRELEKAWQSAPGKPNDAPCTDAFSTPANRRRERSALLQPARATTAGTASAGAT